MKNLDLQTLVSRAALRASAAWLTLSALALPAAADLQEPGSLLLFPEFDNRSGIVTVLTVTNTFSGQGDIEVELVYIGKLDSNNGDVGCEEFNRTEIMTGNDTISLLTIAHNPQQEQGFVYAFARDGVANPIVHNYLIGNVMTVSGLQAFEFSVNPQTFRGLAGETNGNGLRDLNGVEYEAAPAQVLIPRFLGQGGFYGSELILIGLSGGTKFSTTVDMLVYNDNEEVFSSEYTFKCWERVFLANISAIFDNGYLATYTNDDPMELMGAPHVETGWMRVWGAVANSTATTIANPAVQAVLIERIGNRGVADLPFGVGDNPNGSLFSRSVSGGL